MVTAVFYEAATKFSFIVFSRLFVIVMNMRQVCLLDLTADCLLR